MYIMSQVAMERWECVIERGNFEPMTDKQWKDFTRFMDATVDSTLITACGDLNLKWTGDSEEKEEEEEKKPESPKKET